MNQWKGKVWGTDLCLRLKKGTLTFCHNCPLSLAHASCIRVVVFILDGGHRVAVEGLGVWASSYPVGDVSHTCPYVLPTGSCLSWKCVKRFGDGTVCEQVSDQGGGGGWRRDRRKAKKWVPAAMGGSCSAVLCLSFLIRKAGSQTCLPLWFTQGSDVPATRKCSGQGPACGGCSGSGEQRHTVWAAWASAVRLHVGGRLGGCAGQHGQPGVWTGCPQGPLACWLGASPFGCVTGPRLCQGAWASLRVA